MVVVSSIIQFNYLFTWLFNSSKDNYKVSKSKENKETNAYKRRQSKAKRIIQIITIILVKHVNHDE
jgi:hypothetical protein